MSETPKRLPFAEQIRKALEEGILHAQGKITLKTTIVEIPDPPPEMPPEDVTRLRTDLGLAQDVFAQVLNVSMKALQSWERGTRKPSGAAPGLIQVVRSNPEAVLRAAGLSARGDREQPPNTTTKVLARPRPAAKRTGKTQAV